MKQERSKNKMHTSNKIIHGLWIGDITPMVLLTIHSFLQHGHEFHLWRYAPSKQPLPKGVRVRDANEIIPKEEVFQKKSKDSKNGLGKGSYGAPFSDLFRYKLLYEQGGWWVDMDVTCLQPFDFETPYYFRAHPILPMVGSVLKCPPQSELMRLSYEQTQARCNEETEEWLLPNKILNQVVQSLGLSQYILDGHSNKDDFHEVQGLMQFLKPIPEEWYFIHWINEEWRTRGIAADTFFEETSFSKLLKKYQLPFHSKVLPTNTRYLWLFREYIRQLKRIIKRQFK